MQESLLVAEGFRAAKRARIDLREGAWSYCLDQRPFGPGRLLVAFHRDPR